MIYLDHNATSPPLKSHLENLFSQFQMASGNPSSPHALGRCASVALTQSRRSVAQALGVDVSQLIFVSGASEADNMATLGVLRAQNVATSHAITSNFEHPAIIEPLEFLEKNEGLTLTKINPDEKGFISIEKIIQSLSEKTNYISLMAANNEVGTIQPVQLLGDFLHYKRWGILSKENEEKIKYCESFLSPNVTKEHLQKIHFHVDAVQTFGKIKQKEWFSEGFDSCAMSAHKLGGLSGVGALFLRRGRPCRTLVLGGAQEKNRRAGTENIMGILSFGLICEELVQNSWWEKINSMNEKRIYLFNALSQMPSIALNSSLSHSIPNTVHFSLSPNSLSHKNGEDLLLELDLKGICASSGSACSSGANLPSRVLMAMNKSVSEAKNAVRMSMGPNTTQEEIDFVIKSLKELL